MINKTRNKPLSFLLCLVLLLNYSYLPRASAQENPPLPTNSLTLSSSGSILLDAQNTQSIQGDSVDLKPSKIRPAAGGPPAGIRPAVSKEKIRGVSIAASNKSKISGLQAKPGRLNRAEWRKQSVSLARSPRDFIKTAKSPKLTQLEAKRKKRGEFNFTLQELNKMCLNKLDSKFQRGFLIDIKYSA